MRSIRLLSTVLIAASIGTGAPVITSIANAAGNIGFNSPIAQGSIFVIKGSGLGPANILIDSSPFQHTTLGGTSIAITVGSTTVNALMYYASDGQVAALLPSNTPLTSGGNFTVTYNGQTSAALGHGLVASNVGVFSVDSSGQGPGIVTYPDYSLVSPVKAANCGGPNTTCGAANPGDALIIWATGMGPVNGGTDSSGAGLGQNMPNVAVTVYLGGVKAPVTYQGRSGCCIGEDQIVFTVPPNAPTGCAVPLVIQVGTTTNTISNTTLIPIAKGSRSCTPSSPALAAVGSDNVQQAVSAGPINFGDMALKHRLQPGNTPSFLDQGDFTFAKILSYVPGTQPFFTSFVDYPPVGTCTVIPDPNGNTTAPFGNFDPLDPGSSFTVKGPNGSVPVAGNPGEFKPIFSQSGSFLVAGAYSITSNGGPDVGPINNAAVTIPATPTYLSPTPNGLSVTRSNGLTVTWNPNGSTGHVEIDVASATDNTFNVGSLAACTAPASAGTFTIPPYVLLPLPANNFTYLGFGSGLQWPTAESVFTAKGLTVGLVQAFVDGNFFGGFALK